MLRPLPSFIKPKEEYKPKQVNLKYSSSNRHLLRVLFTKNQELLESMDILDALVWTELARSRKRGRKLIRQGLIRINGKMILDKKRVLLSSDFQPAGALVLEAGTDMNYIFAEELSTEP